MFKTGPPVLRDFAASESFDANQYLHHLRRRARFILIVCAAAAVLVLAVSLLIPKQYTATASIVIDPPAAGDLRAAIAVNPAYLESLRSYELFASSDSLFLRALDKFHLRDSRPVESIKRRVLKVTKLRDTKILQIEVTLPDPAKAQALAQFLAEQTVSLNRAGNRENEQELLDEAQRQSDETGTRLERLQTERRELNSRQPIESLRAEMETLTALRKALRRDLADSRVELAEYAGRADDPRVESARARLDSLEKQDAEIQRQIDAKAPALGRREARADELERGLRAAQTAHDSADTRLRDLHSAEGLRGERLRVMDPGVVPERPSFPNIGLNVALALAVALIACITYFTLTFRPLIHDRSSES